MTLAEYRERVISDSQAKGDKYRGISLAYQPISPKSKPDLRCNEISKRPKMKSPKAPKFPKRPRSYREPISTEEYEYQISKNPRPRWFIDGGYAIGSGPRQSNGLYYAERRRSFEHLSEEDAYIEHKILSGMASRIVFPFWATWEYAAYLRKSSTGMENGSLEHLPAKEQPWAGEFEATNNPEWLVKFASDLTNKATNAEIRLNDALSSSGIELFFQFPLEKYILDIFIPSKRIAIEVDGEYHYSPEQWAKDRERTEWLWKTKSIRVIRFDNDEVKSNLHGVVRKILKMCGKDA